MWNVSDMNILIIIICGHFEHWIMLILFFYLVLILYWYALIYITHVEEWDCLPYAFSTTLFVFDLGRPRTPAASNIEPFVTKDNSWKSLKLNSHQELRNGVGPLSPTERLWDLTQNPLNMITTPIPLCHSPIAGVLDLPLKSIGKLRRR